MRKVKVGDIIKDMIYSGRDGKGRPTYAFQDWIVTDVYPYHVLAERGEFRKSFCLGWLIQHGYERQSDYYEALRMSRNQHKDAGGGIIRRDYDEYDDSEDEMED